VNTLMTSADARVALALSVVAPMYNEEKGLAEFCGQLRPILDSLEIPYEFLLVDDGSTDASIKAALSQGWPECTVIALAHNVGHQVALEAGMLAARGQWIVTLDADGQHPPELIPAMLDIAVTQSLDVVYTSRLTREEDRFFKRSSALAYYRIVRALTGVSVGNSQADFRLISARVVEDIRSVPGDKVLRLLLPSIGYRSTVLTYEARPRIAGVGRFGVGRQLRMARDSILGFSSKPLRLIAALGVVLSLAALAWLAVVFVTYVATRTITGWASVMTAVLLVGGLTLLSLSIVGEYVARIYDLLRQHPRYSIADVLTSKDSTDEPN
jgi:glycosyltransferase involved in cell wall biosynthesis